MFGVARLNTLAAAMAAAAPTYVSATGGTVSYLTSSGVGYKVHTFGTAGTSTFAVSTGGTGVEAVIVGAGGGAGGISSGGTSQGTGGAGGGQYQLQTNQTVTVQNYSIVAGAAGVAGGNGTNGGFGSSSSALGFTSVGGAGSKGSTGSTPATAGNAGGSGGGFFGGGIANSGTAGTLAGGNAANGGTGTTQGAGGGGSNVAAGGTGNAGGGGLGGTGALGTITYFNGNKLNLGGGGAGAGPGGSDSDYGGGQADFYYGGGARGVFSSSGTVLGDVGLAGAVIIRYPLQTAFAVNAVTSATSQTSTITIPATAAVGDIAILVDYGYLTSTTPPTSVVPAGWTNTVTQSFSTSPAQRMNISYKTLVSGDPGASITGMNTTNMRKTILIYRPTLTPNSISALDIGGVVSTSAISNQFITLDTRKVVLSFAAYGTTGASIATRSSTRTAAQEIANGTNMYVKTFEDQEGTTSTNTIGMSDGGNNCLALFRFILS